MKRIKAYTIIELLVSMLIASIILGLCWNVVIMLQRYRAMIEVKASMTYDLAQAEFLLNRDFTSCNDYSLDGNELSLFFATDTLVYSPTSRHLIRRDLNRKDTLANFPSSITEKEKGITLECCLEFDNLGSQECFQMTRIPSSYQLFKGQDIP